ncbi:hypothetical protein BKA70DRAFT_1084798, partial [Coprinopsis sp. MPI-PUGE-AT-0042]
DPLFHCGVTIARTVEPYHDLLEVVSQGVSLHAKLEALTLTWRNLEGKNREDHELYLKMREIINRDGHEDISQASPAIRSNMIQLVTMGQRDANTRDVKTLKPLVPLWVCLAEGAPINEMTTASQGFCNGVYGKLLCPVTQDWSNDVVKQALCSEPQTFVQGDWPRILFQNGEYHKEAPWDGFLKSRIMVK